MPARLTIEAMEDLAKKNGGRCISNSYVNQKTKLQWECSKNHKWWANSGSVKNGKTWCPICSGNVKLTIEKMNKIAKSRRGLCLSKKYVNEKTKLIWQCSKGHIWKAVPSNVTRGSWCKICAVKEVTDKQRFSIEKMQELAKAKNGKCLSENYTNCLEKLLWQCEKGHRWWTRSIEVSRGKWCPKCGYERSSISRRSTLSDVVKIVSAKGGKCLTADYINNRSKLNLVCRFQHNWVSTPKEIRRGRWCPYCTDETRSEKICRKIFEIVFKVKFPKAKPTWLKNSRGNQMELDGYSEKLGIAFEYQGRHHYQQHDFFHKETSLGQRKIDDLEKLRLCKIHNVFLIQVPYTLNFEELSDYIVKMCEKNKILIPKLVRKIDPRLLDIYSDELIQLQEIAESKKGICLAKAYIDNLTPLPFECKNGHLFEKLPKVIKRGSWCNECRKMKFKSY